MIASDEIITELERELIRSNTSFDPEAFEFLEDYDGPFADLLKENVEVARKTGLPLCQDTGLIEFFVFMGHRCRLEDPIDDILEKAVRKVYREQPYRYSTVEDPLFKRRNRNDNTPPVYHIFSTLGNELEILFLVKGGGSENLSRLYMLNPSTTPERIVDIVVEHIRENGARGCPPLNVGIGIGGSADEAIVLSKMALTMPFKERNPMREYAELEEKTLREINSLGIGYQGLGVGITAYSVHIKEFPTHIATLPLAISVDCYLSRKGKIVIEDRET